MRYALHAYMAEIVRNNDCICYRCGGVSDHIHIAVGLSRMVTVADLVQEVKTESSKWLKKQSPALSDFRWQRGYGVFSLRSEGLKVVTGYIDRQEIHHGEVGFESEYLALLLENDLEYDERYVWD